MTAGRLVGPYQPDADLEPTDLEPPEETWVDVAEYSALGHQLDAANEKLARIAELVAAEDAASAATPFGNIYASIPVHVLRAILNGTQPPRDDPWTSPTPTVPLEGSDL